MDYLNFLYLAFMRKTKRKQNEAKSQKIKINQNISLINAQDRYRENSVLFATYWAKMRQQLLQFSSYQKTKDFSNSALKGKGGREKALGKG
jgi:hypothetical protein